MTAPAATGPLWVGPQLTPGEPQVPLVGPPSPPEVPVNGPPSPPQPAARPAAAAASPVPPVAPPEAPAATDGEAAASPPSLHEQREMLIAAIERVHHPTPAQMAEVRRIIGSSPVLGQGNPTITEHPMSRQECQDSRRKAGLKDDNPEFERICGGKHMAPLFSPGAGQTAGDAKACIDQYEFPDIPCEYPVVWVKAKEAAQLCFAVGKRLCDAHEWEGACEGDVTPPDYSFESVEALPPEDGIRRMRRAHNAKYGKTKSWAYGSHYEDGVCAADSVKSPGCDGGNWAHCGSNTYPSGAFPKCRSTLEVYDQHGNAAEHMNLPLNTAEMASRGSKTLGYTEMKGSWFIFDKYHAHEDWCRWRAPFWHGSRVLDDHSHANYHLGFRCCKNP